MRGILRGFGLKVGKTTQRSFAARINTLVACYLTLEKLGEALLAAHAVLLREFNGLERHVRVLARSQPPGKTADDDAVGGGDCGAHLRVCDR